MLFSDNTEIQLNLLTWITCKWPQQSMEYLSPTCPDRGFPLMLDFLKGNRVEMRQIHIKFSPKLILHFPTSSSCSLHDSTPVSSVLQPTQRPNKRKQCPFEYPSATVFPIQPPASGLQLHQPWLPSYNLKCSWCLHLSLGTELINCRFCDCNQEAIYDPNSW